MLTAAAVRGLGGHMEARLAPQHQGEISRALAAGLPTEDIVSLDDLVDSDGYLFLTAVTDGDTLAGVVREADFVHTDSWIIDPCRSVLRVTRQHPLA